VTSRGAKSIVLGGIGGDAHSVGLIILRRMLERAGYRVRYLATQNSVQDLCVASIGAHAVLVSNMDGHARYYLGDLPAVREEYGALGGLWYLGGNPSVTGDEEALAELADLGFDRVFSGFVELTTVLARLDDDLSITVPVPSALGGSDNWVPHRFPAPQAVRASVLPAPFSEQRDEVLLQWHTGEQARDIHFSAGIQANGCTLAAAQELADQQGRTLIQPRTGVFTATGQRELFRALRDAGADVLSFQVDSLTRNNAYAEAELALKEHTAGNDLAGSLNGFPAVNHGVAELRAIAREFQDVPLQIRHSTRDPRLLAEISFAGGITAYEGGAITYNLPYYRDYQPRESVARWKYVDHLAGVYHERFGIVIDREFFGVLTASLVPPFVAIAANVLEALLAAECGVKSVSLGYAEQGHRAQDVAAIRAMWSLGRRYLDEFAFHDVAVHTVFHQYMGAFPENMEKSCELLRGSAVTAGCSNASRLMLKTYVEALHIPSAEVNTASLHLVRAALDAATIDDVDLGTVAAEEELIIAEATAVLDAALRAGKEEFEESVVQAIDLGLIDVPFSPSMWNAGRALSVRDSTGAVRLADPGHIPLPPDVRQHHAEAVAERLVRRQVPIEQLIEEDVLRVTRGEFDGWPLG